jgi:malonyl-CoA O-methyltransferase
VTIDYRAVARSFSAASGNYDAAAKLQTRVRNELLSRLDGLSTRPTAILDLGAGTGLAARQLKRRFARSRVTAVDVAPGMLEQSRARSRFWRPLHCELADARSLPFADASFDLVYSNLMLQWVEPLDMALAQIARVLKPGGLLLASSFGPETLQELRSAWAQVSGAVHVNQFVDMHDFGSALQRAGLAEPVLDVDRHVVHYATVMDLMRELKHIGAHNADAARTRGLTGRRALQGMTQAYEQLRGPQGVPATWQVVYAVAWAPQIRAGTSADHRAATQAGSETRVSLDSVRAALSRRR